MRYLRGIIVTIVLCAIVVFAGDLTVDGTFTVNSNLTIVGEAVFATNLYSKGNVIIGPDADALDGVTNYSLYVEGDVHARAYSGDGSGLTNLNAVNITGNIPVEQIPVASTISDGLLTAVDKQKLDNISADGGLGDNDASVLLDGSRPMVGNLNLNGRKITGVADASDDGDAASQGRVKTMMQQVPEYGDLSMGEFTSQVALPNRPIPTRIDTDDLVEGAVTLEKMHEISGRSVIGNMSDGYAQPAAIEIKDENDLHSDSDTALATQQSIKTYVDEKFVQGVFSGDVIFNGTMQSPDFVTGTSGWKISSDGDAEFNNIVTHGYVIPAPALEPSCGTFLSFVDVACVPPAGTVVRFTRDGSTPTEVSEVFPVFPTVLTLADSETLVVASFDTFTSRRSDMVTAVYHICNPLAVSGCAPSFDDKVRIRSSVDTPFVFYHISGSNLNDIQLSNISWNVASREIYYRKDNGIQDGFVYKILADLPGIFNYVYYFHSRSENAEDQVGPIYRRCTKGELGGWYEGLKKRIKKSSGSYEWVECDSDAPGGYVDTDGYPY